MRDHLGIVRVGTFQSSDPAARFPTGQGLFGWVSEPLLWSEEYFQHDCKVLLLQPSMNIDMRIGIVAATLIKSVGIRIMNKTLSLNP